MAKLPLYNQSGAAIGEVDLPDALFSAEDNPALLHQVVVAQLANQRQATAMTKNRALVSGGGKKPWRQKGTGRARQGSIRSPQWVGGGRVWGGQVKNYKQDTPKAMKRGSLCCALSRKCRSRAITVVDKIQLENIKTKAFAGILKSLSLGKGTLLVHDGLTEKEMLSARNIKGLKLIRSQDLSTLDAVQAKHLLMVQDVVTSLEKRLAV